jgi:hypothetical protein
VDLMHLSARPPSTGRRLGTSEQRLETRNQRPEIRNSQYSAPEHSTEAETRKAA